MPVEREDLLSVTPCPFYTRFFGLKATVPDVSSSCLATMLLFNTVQACTLQRSDHSLSLTKMLRHQCIESSRPQISSPHNPMCQHVVVALVNLSRPYQEYGELYKTVDVAEKLLCAFHWCWYSCFESVEERGFSEVQQMLSRFSEIMNTPAA